MFIVMFVVMSKSFASSLSEDKLSLYPIVRNLTALTSIIS